MHALFLILVGFVISYFAITAADADDGDDDGCCCCELE